MIHSPAMLHWFPDPWPHMFLRLGHFGSSRVPFWTPIVTSQETRHDLWDPWELILLVSVYGKPMDNHHFHWVNPL